MMAVIFSRCGIGYFRKGVVMRHRLIDEINRRGWSLQEVANRLPTEMKPDISTITRWIEGVQRPRSDMIGALLVLFEKKECYELDLHSAFVNDAPTQCRED